MTLPEKKTEMLELRITPSEKAALQARAEQEGRAVSAVVRHAVSRYLSTPVHPVTPKLRRGWAAATGGVVALAAAAGFSGLAHANQFKLDLQAEVVTPDGDGTRTRRANMEIHMDADEPASFVLSPPDAASPFAVGLLVTEITEDRGRLEITVRNGDEVLGKPVLETELGQRADIQVGEQLVDGTVLPSPSYTISVVPTRLD
jgi:hypothetical protein